MKKSLATPLLVLTLPVVAAFMLGTLEAQSGYQIVVNSANPESAMVKAEVAKLFLKKTRTWSSGLKVAPVDQAPSRSVRTTFTRDVHGKSVAAVKNYWQKMIFSGDSTPPPELASDNEVMNYVRNKSGGIGYVSAGVTVGSGLKVLRLSP